MDTSEFKEELIKGLFPTLRVTLGAIDAHLQTLEEVEERVSSAYELHREALPNTKREIYEPKKEPYR